MKRYKVLAENMSGKQRFIGFCIGHDFPKGVFDLYADECEDDEEIVLQEAPRGIE